MKMIPISKLLLLVAVNLIFGLSIVFVLQSSGRQLDNKKIPQNSVNCVESNCPAQISLNSPEIPTKTIYFITPTYKRNEQIADLTRLGQTLRLVPGLMWIVVEDSNTTSEIIEDLLLRSCVHFVYLTAQSVKFINGKRLAGKGVAGRQAGLDWISEQLSHNPETQGVLYFGDDDNTYDIELFKHMRKVQKVGIWPVAYVGGAQVEKPLLKFGKVVGWDSVWPHRTYGVDMAGFGVNLQWFKTLTNVKISKCTLGAVESCFLQQTRVPANELEVYAMQDDNNVKRIMVWHTKTHVGAAIGGEKGYIV